MEGKYMNGKDLNVGSTPSSVTLDGAGFELAPIPPNS